MGFYDTGMIVLCNSGDPSRDESCLDIQLGKKMGEQDRACSVAQSLSCMYISGVSSAVLICSKKCFTENSFLPEEALSYSPDATKNHSLGGQLLWLY